MPGFNYDSGRTKVCFQIPPQRRLPTGGPCCPAPCCNPYPPCCIEILPVIGCCPDVACRKPPFKCPDPCCPEPDPRCCQPCRCYTVSCPRCPTPPKCPPPCPLWYFKDEDPGPLRGVEYPKRQW